MSAGAVIFIPSLKSDLGGAPPPAQLFLRFPVESFYVISFLIVFIHIFKMYFLKSILVQFEHFYFYLFFKFSQSLSESDVLAFSLA